MTLREQLQSSLGSAYTLDRELGGGGMSRVFVAEETRLGRKVVVKVLSTELAAGLSAERFEREIRLAASLQQANIVPVLSAGETGGVPYFTMPFVEGESLRARLLALGSLPIREAVSILRDVARALAYAHDRGIVHRDIKPDNVLLSGGAAVVTDFGIAKAISAARTDTDSAVLTQLGTAIGTPAYISPEQASGDPNVDHRADLYSFGCLAYELLTGHPPFTHRTPHRVMAAHLTEAPRPVQELRADTPPALAALIMRCLEKEPSARSQSAAEIVNTLDTVTTSDAAQPAMPAILLGGPHMVGKALGLYAVAVILVAVLAQAAIVGIGLPSWVLPGVLIVMAFGLPVILLTAYTQRVVRRTMTRSPTFTPGGTPSSPTDGTMATLAMRASSHLSWRRAGFAGAWAVGGFVVMVGVFMLLRALGIGPAGSLFAAGKLTEKAPVVIADFTTTNTDSALGPVVSDAVRAGLGQSNMISVLSPDAVTAALTRMQRPPGTRIDFAIAREIAQREGIRAVIDGSITGVAGGYIITLRLIAADSATELASLQATAEGPQGVIDAADKLTRKLRSRIGESLRAVQRTPRLEDVTTSSLDALRAFSSGARSTDLPTQLAAFRRAVAIDTTFADAWYGLSVILVNMGAAEASIDSAIDHAFANRVHMPDKDRVMLMGSYYYSGAHADRSRAIAAFNQAWHQYGVSQAAGNVGEVLRSMRQYARAESLEVVTQRGEDSVRFPSWIPRTNVIQLELDQGHIDAAQKVFAEAERALPNTGFIRANAALIPYARGELATTGRTLDSLAHSGAGYAQSMGLRYGANLALVEGKVGRAQQLFQQLASDDRTSLLDSLTLVTARAWFRDTSAGAAERIDAAVGQHPLRNMGLADRPYFQIATAYARIGRADRAQAVMAMYRADVRDTALLRNQSADLHDALGEIALAEHHPDRAVVEFRRGDIAYDGQPARECGACLPILLARAFDAANETDSAIAEYEAFIAAPFYDRLAQTDPLNLALAHERLGELYDARGDAGKAASHYAKFAALWANADRDVQPRVTNALRQVARLGLEGADARPAAKAPPR